MNTDEIRKQVTPETAEGTVNMLCDEIDRQADRLVKLQAVADAHIETVAPRGEMALEQAEAAAGIPTATERLEKLELALVLSRPFSLHLHISRWDESVVIRCDIDDGWRVEGPTLSDAIDDIKEAKRG